MKYIILILAVFVVGVSSYMPTHVYAQAAGQGFFNTLPDVPLMEGLVEVDDYALSFDKPEGRIMIGAAYFKSGLNSDLRSGIDADSVLSYYQRALPQFGWRMVDAYSYSRGAEMLRLSIRERAKKDGFDRVLEITISP